MEAPQYTLSPSATVAQRYEVVRALGAGGFGEVYCVRDMESGQLRALKLLHSSHPEAKARFEREAEITTAVRHPNICPTLDYGIADEGLFLVMELLVGDNLDDVMRSHEAEGTHISGEDVRTVGVAVCEALKTAHDQGVVHRDIKPGNIFLLAGDGPLTPARVRVLDFGIARLTDPGEKMTKTGMVIGTPAYMAPEQLVDAQPASEITDVYSLGATLHAAMTNQDPRSGDMASIISSILRGVPIGPSLDTRPDVSGSLRNAIQSACEQDTSRRCPSISELQRLLLTSEASSGVAAPSPSLVDAQRALAIDSGVRTPTLSLEEAKRLEPGAHAAPFGLAYDEPSGPARIPTKRSALPWVLGLGVLLLGGVAAAAYTFGGEDGAGAADSRPVVVEATEDDLPTGADPDDHAGEHVAPTPTPMTRRRRRVRSKTSSRVRAAESESPAGADQSPAELAGRAPAIAPPAGDDEEEAQRPVLPNVDPRDLQPRPAQDVPQIVTMLPTATPGDSDEPAEELRAALRAERRRQLRMRPQRYDLTSPRLRRAEQRVRRAQEALRNRARTQMQNMGMGSRMRKSNMGMRSYRDPRHFERVPYSF